jgi:hypothetical protein
MSLPRSFEESGVERVMADVQIPVPYVGDPGEYHEERTNSYGLETWDVFVFTDRPKWGPCVCVGSDRRTGIPLIVGLDEKDSAEYCDEGPVKIIGRFRFREPPVTT